MLRAEAVDGEPDLVAAYNAAREQEYGEIIAGCGEVIAGIEAMTAAGHFRYHDLGEKDAELKRLSVRTGTIRARDALGAVNADATLSSLARCHAVVDEFARRVYQTDTVSAAGPRAAGDVKLENNGGGARLERGNAANGPCQAR